MKIFLALLLTLNCAFAEVVKVEKGAPAPFTGALVDASQMSKFRASNEQNIKLKDLQVVNINRIAFYQQEAEHFQIQIKKERIQHFWEKLGYFTLGVVVTGLAAKVAIESVR